MELKYRKKLKPKEKRNIWLSRIFLWATILIVMFPIFAILTASLSAGEVFVQTTIFPTSWTFDNYIKVIKESDFLIWAWNSLKICLIVATIQLSLALPASYAFSKLKFKGKQKGLMGLMILQMFPTIMLLPAVLGVVYACNLMDLHWVLILILSGGSAYHIWLLKGYIDGIPNELIEAAQVDGATDFQIFIKIVLPLVRNMLIVIFLFAFIAAYSDFVYTSALIKDPSLRTLSTGMKMFIEDEFAGRWTQYAAASIMASLPIVILFMGCQKYISKGLTAGSVKE